MNDGELDFSNHDVFPNPNMGDQELPTSCSMDSFFDEILKETHTHTHTRNPPGPDFSHTHTYTCFHVHTKILAASGDDDKAATNDTAESTDKENREMIDNSL
ncbi:hypothetical protein AAC387_Pa02g3913 [Persea americana]